VRLDTGSQEAGLDEEVAWRVQTKWVSAYGKVDPHPRLVQPLARTTTLCSPTAERGMASATEGYFHVLSVTELTRIVRQVQFRWVNLTYPTDARDAATSGLGRHGNHRLNDFAESSTMNVRGSPETEASDQPVKPGERRSGHSSPRLGEPATRRRAAVCWEFRSKGNRVQT
jgi:hypothetical protein